MVRSEIFVPTATGKAKKSWKDCAEEDMRKIGKVGEESRDPESS